MRSPGELVDGGVIVAEKLKAPNHVRINDICEDLRELLDEFLRAKIIAKGNR